MRTCGRFLAGIFAFLFIVSASITLLVFNLDAALMDSEAYKAALIEEDIYARLPGFVGQQIQYAMTFNPCVESQDQCESDPGPGDPEAGPPAYFRILSDDDWDHLIGVLLEPEWLQTTVEIVLDQVFDNLNLDAPPQPISVSLVDIKVKLAGEVGYQALRDVLAKQPDCTPEQILQLYESQVSGGAMDDFLLCNPPEILEEVVDPLMREAIQSAASGIPDEMTFELPFLDRSGSISDVEFGGDPIQLLLTARRLLRFSPLVPAALLLLVTVFGVRSLRDWLLWWGVPLLFTGMISLLISYLSSPLLGWLIPRLIGDAAPVGVSEDMFSLGVDLVNAVLRQVTRKIMFQAGVIAGIGFVLSLAAFFVKPSRSSFGDPLPNNE